MKKIVFLFCALVIFAVPLSALAQSEEDLAEAIDNLLGHWKRNYASPSYGIAFFTGEVQGGDYVILTNDERQVLVPAVDLRIFRGVNVSRRGGFYTGFETGVLIFAAPGEGDRFFDSPYYGPLSTNRDINFDVKMDGGLVFLMAKYGLRADIGIALIGISLGLEAGAGASLFSGGYQFYTGDPQEPTVEVGSGSTAAIMGLIVDLNGEAALRLGRNLRLFLKAGMIVAPIGLPENRWDEYENIPLADAAGEPWVNDNERDRYLLSKYKMDLNPFGFGARVGFALNFD